jgi:hypothetical protein
VVRKIEKRFDGIERAQCPQISNCIFSGHRESPLL